MHLSPIMLNCYSQRHFCSPDLLQWHVLQQLFFHFLFTILSLSYCPTSIAAPTFCYFPPHFFVFPFDSWLVYTFVVTIYIYVNAYFMTEPTQPYLVFVMNTTLLSFCLYYLLACHRMRGINLLGLALIVAVFILLCEPARAGLPSMCKPGEVSSCAQNPGRQVTYYYAFRSQKAETDARLQQGRHLVKFGLTSDPNVWGNRYKEELKTLLSMCLLNPNIRGRDPRPPYLNYDLDAIGDMWPYLQQKRQARQTPQARAAHIRWAEHFGLESTQYREIGINKALHDRIQAVGRELSDRLARRDDQEALEACIDYHMEFVAAIECDATAKCMDNRFVCGAQKLEGYGHNQSPRILRRPVFQDFAALGVGFKPSYMRGLVPWLQSGSTEWFEYRGALGDLPGHLTRIFTSAEYVLMNYLSSSSNCSV